MMFDRSNCTDAKYYHARKLHDDKVKSCMERNVPKSAKENFRRKPYEYTMIQHGRV